jgi:O-antigen ligase
LKYNAQQENVVPPEISIRSYKFTPAHCIAKSLFFLPLIYVFSIMWWIPKGSKYVPGLVVLALISYFVLRGKLPRDKVTVLKQRFFLIAFSAFFAYGMIVYFWQGESWTALRAYLFSLIYAAILSGQIVDRTKAQNLLIISATGLVIVSFFQCLEGYARVKGFINPIPFATGLAAVACALMFLFLGDSDRKKVCLAYFLTASLVVCVFMTGTRGVMLPVIMLAIGLVCYQVTRILKNWWLLAGVVVLAFSLVAFTAYEASSKRIDHTVDEIEAITSGDYSTSIGLRFQMWAAAIPIIKHNPLFGVGDGHIELLKRHWEQGLVSDSLMKLNPGHYHNQYVDILVKRGAIGLALFLIFLWGAVKTTFVRGTITRPGLAIAAVVFIYSMASLTDMPFHHPDTIYLFVLLVMLMSGLSRHSEKRVTNEN